MPENNENTETCTTYSANTKKIENGEVTEELVVLTNVPTPLFVLFAYGGRGKADFLKAAEFKKKRLTIKYSEAEIRIIEGFKYPHEFKAEWTKLYTELTQSENICKYSLWEIHYFGHGDYESLSLYDDTHVYFNDSDNMEKLPWHLNKGIFVLHSCRGAAYEDTLDVKKINTCSCLAKTISKQQSTRCLGQSIYANFAANPSSSFVESLYMATTTTDAASILIMREQIEKILKTDIDGLKYRSTPEINAMAQKLCSFALWGYALLTNKTGAKVLKNKELYESNKKIQESNLPKKYPIYEEVEKLASKNQIFPCRVFNNGKLEERIVELDVFNKNDLEYI